ncbi:MAG: ORF6N domain-containing protein [Paludibacteraceae bacterium]|nr:ORF6N domain-containing protein [Paludibacteraceae bacterium]
MNKSIIKTTVQGAVKPQVYNVRGKRVVLDRELAAYVGMSTGNLNLYVKRNIKLFDDEMWFKLSEEECLRLQIVIPNMSKRGGSRYLPFAFTAEGISMLEKVLKRIIPIEFEDEVIEAEVLPKSWNEGTVVLYQPNQDIKIDVRVENETVWLTQEQMALLFGTTQPNIAMHIRNIFDDGELEIGATYKDFLYVQTEGGKQKSRYIKIYNLDMIISVGYRVNTRNGIAFRQWATKVLKQHLMHKGSFEHRVQLIENNIKAIEQQQQKNTNDISDIKEQVKFVVDTKLPPIEMVFYEGENFKAYDFLCSLIESANNRIMLIDNYVDRKALLMLNKRKDGVSATIYTHYKKVQEQQFILDLEEANRNRPAPIIEVYGIKNDHDRFLIIDETVYHLGPSVKDAGVKRCAVIKMISTPEMILKNLASCTLQ